VTGIKRTNLLQNSSKDQQWGHNIADGESKSGKLQEAGEKSLTDEGSNEFLKVIKQ